MISFRSWFGAVSAVALATSVVWVSVRSGSASNRPTALSAQAIEAKALRWQSLQVEAAEPAEQLWTDAFPGVLQLDESKVARVSEPLSGRVARVYAALGHEVREGAPLFSVASMDPAILVGQRLDSRGELTVRAPRAGRIVETRLSVGQDLRAPSERALLTIADLSSFWLSVELFEADLAGISRGTVVSVTVSGLPDSILSGEVDAISSAPDPERRAVPVRVRLDNPDGKLKVNMFAKARFLTTPPVGTVSVRTSALRSDGSREYLYVRSADGRYERRWVKSGSVVAGRTLIHEGLAAGDEVAIRGMTLLDNRLARLP
jgi:multidrug efflux pump subunit AcrA (membrane-fusion protein)